MPDNETPIAGYSYEALDYPDPAYDPDPMRQTARAAVWSTARKSRPGEKCVQHLRQSASFLRDVRKSRNGAGRSQQGRGR
jgi:hypothetical protein